MTKDLPRPSRRCDSHRPERVFFPALVSSKAPFLRAIYIAPEVNIDKTILPLSMSLKLLFAQNSPLDTTVTNTATGHPLYEIETENNRVQKITVVRKLDLSTSNFSEKVGDSNSLSTRSRRREHSPCKRGDREDPLESDRRG